MYTRAAKPEAVACIIERNHVLTIAAEKMAILIGATNTYVVFLVTLDLRDCVWNKENVSFVNDLSVVRGLSLSLASSSLRRPRAISAFI